MKVKRILTLCLAFIMLFTLSAIGYGEENNKVIEKSEIEEINGWHLEKVTTEELVTGIMRHTGKSEKEVREEYNINDFGAKTIWESYRMSKTYKVPLGKNNTFVQELEHEVFVKFYAEGSFREIMDVYSCGVTPKSGLGAWESTSDFICSWDGSHVHYVSSGNVTYTGYINVGLAAGVVNASVGTNYFYRKYKKFDSTFNLY